MRWTFARIQTAMVTHSIRGDALTSEAIPNYLRTRERTGCGCGLPLQKFSFGPVKVSRHP
jgi:hypothetical protein